MRTPTFAAFTLCSLALSPTLVGCSASPPDATASSTSDLSAATADSHSDPFFTVEHPHTGSLTTRDGVTMPVPFSIYDSRFALLYGTIDLSSAADFAAGTGYSPVALSNGKAVGIVMLNDFIDTDLGPYHEVVFGFMAVPSDPNAQPSMYVNPFSLAVPQFNPAAAFFPVKLLIDKKDVLSVAREIQGLDADYGHPSDVWTEDRVFASASEQRALTLLTELRVDYSPAVFAAEGQGLAAALGLVDPSQLPPPPAEIAYDWLTKDANGVAVRSPHAVKGQSVLRVMDDGDRFVARCGTTMGNLITSFRFSPELVQEEEHALAVDLIDHPLGLPSDPTTN